ncbi:hypothetical protein JCM8097_003633 [Rhodosporidiobolus ruineniae]
MSDRVGYWWAAQRNFQQCSGGLSISEWCSMDQDLCCGLCPNPPITGPGTAIVMTIGTLLTLLNILIWKSEAPYNLFFQLLGTDYTLADFLNRLVQKEGRLTAFHAAMIPLAVMSVVPSLIAAVTVEAEYFHARSHLASTVSRSQSNRFLLQNVSLVSLTDMQIARAMSAGQATASILVIHLIVWAALFPFALFYRNPSQSNCDGPFNFRRYRLVIGVVTASFYLVALLLVAILLWSFRTRRKGRRSTPPDVLESIGRIWTTFGTWVAPSRTGYSKPRERVRWTLALAAYLIWVACYLGVYFSLGDNPFDFGQVAACFGTLAPFILIGRAYMDQKDGWKVSKEKWAKHAEEVLGEADEGKRVKEGAPAPLPLSHSSSRPPPVNFNFSRPINRQSHWPVHKVVCLAGADGTACYLPPLLEAEFVWLNTIPEPLYQVPYTLFKASGMWEKSWRALTHELHKSSTDCELREPMRSHVLAFVRGWPYYSLVLRVPPGLYPTHMPYQNLGVVHEEVWSMESMTNNPQLTTVDVFRTHNAFYRQLLTMDSLAQQSKLSPPPAALTRKTLQAAIDRFQTEYKNAKLSPEKRAKMATCIESGTEEANEAMERLKA